MKASVVPGQVRSCEAPVECAAPREDESLRYPCARSPIDISAVVIELLGRRCGPVSMVDIAKYVEMALSEMFEFPILGYRNHDTQAAVIMLKNNFLIAKCELGYVLTDGGKVLREKTRSGALSLFRGVEL